MSVATRELKNLGLAVFPSCKTCKYWNAKYSPTDFPNIRRCSKPVMYWNAREWVNEDDETVSKMKDEHRDLMVFVQDSSDYYAKLITREDFFCAHWEKNDE
jgi:hypothetical protein